MPFCRFGASVVRVSLSRETCLLKRMYCKHGGLAACDGLVLAACPLCATVDTVALTVVLNFTVGGIHRGVLVYASGP